MLGGAFCIEQISRAMRAAILAAVPEPSAKLGMAFLKLKVELPRDASIGWRRLLRTTLVEAKSHHRVWLHVVLNSGPEFWKASRVVFDSGRDRKA
jgi:hypothetical protein